MSDAEEHLPHHDQNPEREFKTLNTPFQDCHREDAEQQIQRREPSKPCIKIRIKPFTNTATQEQATSIQDLASMMDASKLRELQDQMGLSSSLELSQALMQIATQLQDQKGDAKSIDALPTAQSAEIKDRESYDTDLKSASVRYTDFRHPPGSVHELSCQPVSGYPGKENPSRFEKGILLQKATVPGGLNRIDPTPIAKDEVTNSHLSEPQPILDIRESRAVARCDSFDYKHPINVSIQPAASLDQQLDLQRQESYHGSFQPFQDSVALSAQRRNDSLKESRDSLANLSEAWQVKKGFQPVKPSNTPQFRRISPGLDAQTLKGVSVQSMAQPSRHRWLSVLFRPDLYDRSIFHDYSLTHVIQPWQSH